MKYLKFLFFIFLFCVLLSLPACSFCNHEYEETIIHPTCDVDGKIVNACIDCGDSYEEVLPAYGHTFTSKKTGNTCTQLGYTEHTCHCGFSYRSEITSALGHNYKETVLPPTCVESGFTTYVCERCDDTYKDHIVPPLGHELVDKTTDPTCTDQGFVDYGCKNCDLRFTSDHVNPIGHLLNESITDPTCTEQGFTTYTCQLCEYSFVSSFVEPKGHTLAEEIISTPTCTLTGETVYKCGCGYSYSETYAPLGHNFKMSVISPTVSDMGYTEFYCDCGFNYKGNYRFYSDILDNAYSGNNQVIAHGIDISKWNHTVDANGNYEPLDWVALKEAGVDYVMLKIGSTIRNDNMDGGIEPTFEMDYEGAKAAGIDVGVYFFTYSSSVSEIRTDAENVLDWLEGKQFEYPIYLDIEDVRKEDYYPSEIASPIITEMCLTFFSALQKENYYTGLYVSNEFLFNIMQTENMIELFEIWYSRYPSKEHFDWNADDLESFVWDTEKYGETLGMWQYCKTGKLSPIVGAVDFDYSYKDYPTLIKSNGFNGFSLVENEETETESETEETETEETESFEHMS